MALQLLNESLEGINFGARMIAGRRPIGARPRGGRSSPPSAPAFTKLEGEESVDSLYTEGASRLLSEADSPTARADQLMTALEERANSSAC